MLCSLSSPHTLDETTVLCFRILMQLQNVLSLGSKEENDWFRFWKDTNIENLINERDKLSTELQKNNTETNRIRFMSLCHEVEEVISTPTSVRWTGIHAGNFDLPKKYHQRCWKVIKTLMSINATKSRHSY
ncbi:hypothetical protein TNCV_4848391 [Trichonephila clavipes]|nr:hypothetical protein TNCV_4848391 [Trichonephila clavipes]